MSDKMHYRYGWSCVNFHPSKLQTCLLDRLFELQTSMLELKDGGLVRYDCNSGTISAFNLHGHYLLLLIKTKDALLSPEVSEVSAVSPPELPTSMELS